MDKVGDFAQRALNCEKGAKRLFSHDSRRLFSVPTPLWQKGGLFSRVFHTPLSILLLTAILGLTHCKSDDNGGGGGGAAAPPDPSQCEADAAEQNLSFASGDGTEDSPFEVSSPEQLANIGQLLYCNYRLTQDITLSGEWRPLGASGPCDGGNDDACFQGSLDGNDFMISGLSVNTPEENYGGLFGYTGGNSEIRNVALSGLSVTAKDKVGGLAGRNGGIISHSISTGAVSGASDVGGLVGNNRGDISHSYAAANVSGTTGTLGGLAGDNYGDISNSYAAGTVSGGSSATSIGGLVGNNRGSGNITNSYAAGAASGLVALGGLVGNSVGDISNSYAAGAVSATLQTAGGLAGQNGGNISNSYATGAVSGGSVLGGLVGFDDSGTISNSYWDEDTTGQSASAGSGATGLSTAQMQAVSGTFPENLGAGFQLSSASYPKVFQCLACTGTLTFSSGPSSGAVAKAVVKHDLLVRATSEGGI